MKYLLNIFCICILFACDRKTNHSYHQDKAFVENGLVKQYDEQNRLSAEINFKNGVRHGVTRIYYSSGVLSDEIMYVDDEKSGTAKKYHKNGNIYSLTPYWKDEKEGVQKKYYSNGKIWAETPYFKGQPGIGLKEYKYDGSLRENFPGIEVQKFKRSDRIVLKFFLSNYSKNVVFYVSDLMKDKYIPVMAKPMYAKEGSVSYEIPLSKNISMDTVLSIVAKYQTQNYNIYVSKRDYRIVLK